MSKKSTIRAQFLADIDQARRLRRRFWVGLVVTVFGYPIIIAANEVHPFILVLCILPPILTVIFLMQLWLIRCPKCGEFFWIDLNAFDLTALPRMRGKWFNPLFGGSRCVHCDFAL